MANWGIKISKPGFDVGTATDDNLIFSSKFNVPKTNASGGSSVIVSGGNGTTTIAHGLSAIPIALVYMEKVAGDNKRYLMTAQVLSGDPFQYSIDGTNLIVSNLGSVTAGTYNFYYYTFLDAL